MKKLIKPVRLKKGDKVATISLSSGKAGDPEILWRYNQGKKRLQDIFGLNVVEMEHTLSGTDYLYDHPEKRAEDLMNAFKDKSIKGIFSCIGGEESIRILPYIDYDVIKENPKIFIGYSDSTIIHMICYKAGLSSFYGPSVLVDFAENVKMHDYTINWIKRSLFSNDVLGDIPCANEWTGQMLPWERENKYISRVLNKNTGYELLQGSGKVKGRLLGGCINVMEFAKGTELFPMLDCFTDSILFFETSQTKIVPMHLRNWLRNYGMIGILNKVNGIVFGKPYDNVFYDEYKEEIIKVLKEFNLENLPVLYNCSFGHCEPKFVLPYGALAEIDCNNKSFKILESGVL